MGIFVRQNENRSQLQERLAAELREKAKLQAASAEPIDQTKKSNYIKDTDQASSRTWAFILIGVVLVVGAIIYVMSR